MDTDNLSIEAYKAIMIEAERFNHDLTLAFGVNASDCANEKEFLEMAKELTTELAKLETDLLDDVFFGEIPDITKLKITLQKILTNIAEVEKMPEDKKHYDY